MGRDQQKSLRKYEDYCMPLGYLSNGGFYNIFETVFIRKKWSDVTTCKFHNTICINSVKIGRCVVMCYHARMVIRVLGLLNKCGLLQTVTPFSFSRLMLIRIYSRNPPLSRHASYIS
jgi:hypothetical protein